MTNKWLKRVSRAMIFVLCVNPVVAADIGQFEKTVPYTGANKNVNLGTHSISAANIGTAAASAVGDFDISGAASAAQAAAINAAAVAAAASYVPTTRTINGSALTGNVTITTVSGNAGTATALAADPADCGVGNYARGINAAGSAVGCTSAAGGGTVTSASVVSANGLAGTVTNATTTPAITLATSVTGMLKGAASAVVAASAGTDYLAPTGVGSGLTLSRIGSSTYSTIQHWRNNLASAGVVSGGEITDNGGATINVAAGSGTIRSTDSNTGELFFTNWAASSVIAVPTNTTRFVGVEYNAGTPRVTIRSSDAWNYHTEFQLGTVINEAGALHVQIGDKHLLSDLPTHLLERLEYTNPYEYDIRNAGLMLGESGTRNITLTTGNVWQKLTKFTIPALNTAVSGSFDAYYRDGASGFTKVSSLTQWDNLKFDNNTGTLATLGSNKFGVLWFYLEPDDGMLVMVYGRGEYAGAAAAEGESPPATLPSRLVEGGKLLSRLIFQKSAATSSSIASALIAQFSPVLASAHNNLSNLDFATAGHTGVLPNANTTATATNTASAIVARDASGLFAASGVNTTGTSTSTRNGDYQVSANDASKVHEGSGSLCTSGTLFDVAKEAVMKYLFHNFGLTTTSNGTVCTLGNREEASAGYAWLWTESGKFSAYSVSTGAAGSAVLAANMTLVESVDVAAGTRTARWAESAVQATRTMTVDSVSSRMINNQGQTAATVLTLPAASTCIGCNFIYSAASGVVATMKIKPNSADKFYFDATAVLLAGSGVISAATQTIGDAVGFSVIRTGSAAWGWLVKTIRGTAWTPN